VGQGVDARIQGVHCGLQGNGVATTLRPSRCASSRRRSARLRCRLRRLDAATVPPPLAITLTPVAPSATSRRTAPAQLLDPSAWPPIIQQWPPLIVSGVRPAAWMRGRVTGRGRCPLQGKDVCCQPPASPTSSAAFEARAGVPDANQQVTPSPSRRRFRSCGRRGQRSVAMCIHQAGQQRGTVQIQLRATSQYRNLSSSKVTPDCADCDPPLPVPPAWHTAAMRWPTMATAILPEPVAPASNSRATRSTVAACHCRQPCPPLLSRLPPLQHFDRAGDAVHDMRSPSLSAAVALTVPTTAGMPNSRAPGGWAARRRRRTPRRDLGE